MVLYRERVVRLGYHMIGNMEDAQDLCRLSTMVVAEGKKGERRTFDAKDEFRFRTIGNAAGVSLTLDGVALPALGGEGKVVHDRIVNRQTLEEAQRVPEAPDTTS